MRAPPRKENGQEPRGARPWPKVEPKSNVMPRLNTPSQKFGQLKRHLGKHYVLAKVRR
jgi:hypothetical protein